MFRGLVMKARRACACGDCRRQTPLHEPEASRESLLRALGCPLCLSLARGLGRRTGPWERGVSGRGGSTRAPIWTSACAGSHLPAASPGHEQETVTGGVFVLCEQNHRLSDSALFPPSLSKNRIFSWASGCPEERLHFPVFLAPR